jgi:hypothetical protein
MHDYYAACKIITYGPGAASVMRINNCIITFGTRSTCVRHLGGLFGTGSSPPRTANCSSTTVCRVVLSRVSWRVWENYVVDRKAKVETRTYCLLGIYIRSLLYLVINYLIRTNMIRKVSGISSVRQSISKNSWSRRIDSDELNLRYVVVGSSDIDHHQFIAVSGDTATTGNHPIICKGSSRQTCTNY